MKAKTPKTRASAALSKSPSTKRTKGQQIDKRMADMLDILAADGDLSRKELDEITAFAKRRMSRQQWAALTRIGLDLVLPRPAADSPQPLTLEQERDILARRITEAHTAIDEVGISQVVEMLEAVETLAHEFRYSRDESDSTRAMESAVIIALEAIGAAGTVKLRAISEAIDNLRLYRGGEVRLTDLHELETARAAEQAGQVEGGDHATK